MAQQIIELTGDEKKLLAAYLRAERAEREHEDSLRRLGAAGEAAGKQIGDGLTKAAKDPAKHMQELLRDLGRLGPEGRKQADAIREHWRETGTAGQRSMQAVRDSLAQLDPTAAAVADRVEAEMAAAAEKIQADLAEADRQSEFRQTLASLRAMGDEGKAIAAQIEADMQAAAQASAGGLDGVLQKLTAMHPAAAEAAERVRAEMTEAAEKVQAELVEADRQSEFRQTLASLRSLGTEGKAIADGIERELKTAAAEAAGGLDGVLSKLRELDPAAADAAEKIRTELAEAAETAEDRFDDTLSKLRSMGPVGRQVADELKKELVAAGKLSEASIDDVVASLRAIDPAAADAAAAIHRRIDDAASKGESSFARFGKSAIGQIAGVASAYIGVQEAIQAVNSYLQEQEELLAKTLDTHNALAKSQIQSARNLANLSVVARSELLSEAAPQIARSTNFADIEAINIALGEVNSTGAKDEETVVAAVTQAARLERLTPEKLADTASGAIAIQNQTGLQDIRQSMALFATANTQSNLVDPSQLANNLPVALGAAIASVPQQDTEEAARQAAAIFGGLTNKAEDTRGDSTRTFMLTFTGKLDQFFSELEGQRINARSELESIERKKDPLEKDLVRAEELRALIPELERLQDPGTLFDRIEALQQNPAARAAFVGDGFGEMQFRPALQALLQDNSDLEQTIRDAFAAIRSDVEFFEEEVATLTNLTPQLRRANAAAIYDAGASVAGSMNNERADRGEVHRIFSEALANTNVGGVTGFFDRMDAWMNTGSWMQGGDATSEAVSGIIYLAERRGALEIDGLTKAEQPLALELESAIDALSAIVANSVAQGEADVAGIAERIQRELERKDTLERVPSLVERTNADAAHERTISVLEKLANTLDRMDQRSPRGPQRPPTTQAAVAAAAAGLTN